MRRDDERRSSRSGGFLLVPQKVMDIRASEQRFAITIPCYRSESTIAETLKGILDQGSALNRLACVVIADDFTPDNTIEVVRNTWPPNQPPLHFSRASKNVGEMVNVNRAVAALPPEVEWFLHMHGDNIPKKGWLEILTDRCLKASPSVGIVCASYDVFGDGVFKEGEERPTAAPVLVPGNLDSIRSTIRRGCWWHNSCSAVRVSTFREVGGFPPGMRQKGDWDFLIRVLKNGWDIEYLPRSLMRYRIHDASASSFAFRVHLDIEESLQIIQKCAPLLTVRDIAGTHLAYSLHLLSRCGASLLRADFLRLWCALRMLVRTGANCLGSLATPGA